MYLDDEISLAHEQEDGQPHFAHRHFRFSDSKLVSSAVNPTSAPRYNAPNTVERIEIAGQNRVPTRVTLAVVVDGLSTGPVDVQFFHDASTAVLTLKKPDCRVTDDWSIQLEY